MALRELARSAAVWTISLLALATACTKAPQGGVATTLSALPSPVTPAGAPLVLTLQLSFTQLPAAVVAPATFAVDVTVIDAATGQPIVPNPALQVTLATSGSGTLLGTTTVATVGAVASFTGLSYHGLEQASLTATTAGVPTATSAAIDFDEPRVAVPSEEVHYVNEAFAPTFHFASALHPAQLVQVTNLPTKVVVSHGAGTLSGGAQQLVTGGIFAPTLAYDAWEKVEVEVVTPFERAPWSMWSTLLLKGDVTTAYVAPGRPIEPLVVEILDGTGAPFAATGDFAWDLGNGGSPLQSGVVHLVGGTRFEVAPAMVSAGNYDLHVAGQSGVTSDLLVPVATLTDAPGKLVILKPGRVGVPYSDTVAPYAGGTATSFVVARGQLPDGLLLDPATGVISGTPTANGAERVQIVALVGTTLHAIRTTVAILADDGSDQILGQNFGWPGANAPYAVTTENTVVATGSTFDNNTQSFQLRTFYPTQIATIDHPLPVLVLHHGRGFDHTEYNDVLGRIASWGFVCVSSGDYYSFYGATNQGYPGPFPYETGYLSAGMESGSGTQEAILRHMIKRNRTAGDVLAGRLDEDRLFVAGHSRGGGSTHGTLARCFNLRATASPPQLPFAEPIGIAGYIALMPFDLWYSADVIAPAVPPVPGGIGAQPYNVPRDLSRLPGMIFAAEEDGDLSYPFADQMIERRSTSTVFLTIWGANHNQTGDSHSPDGFPSINGQTQRNILVQWMTAFLLRFGYDRLDLSTHLFGDEHALSSHVGHVGYHDVAGQRMILDAQNGNVAVNTLGLANTASAGITTSLVYPYPSLGSFGSANPRGLQIAFSSVGAGKAFTSALGGLNASTSKAVFLEIRQSGTTGFNWLTLGVRLTDTNGVSATVPIYDRVANTSSYLPVYPIPGHTSARKLNRFVQLEVPLGNFAGVNLASLASVALVMDNGSTANQLVIDDLRIE